MNMEKPFRIVPTVRALIMDQKGRVLVLQRANTRFGEGRWCLPGGKIDYGEKAEDAVRKEVVEETSLACASCGFLFYRDGLPSSESDMHCPTLFFECSVDGEVRLCDESSDYAWISKDELDGMNLLFRHNEAVETFWKMKKMRA